MEQTGSIMPSWLKAPLSCVKKNTEGMQIGYQSNGERSILDTPAPHTADHPRAVPAFSGSGSVRSQTPSYPFWSIQMHYEMNPAVSSTIELKKEIVAAPSSGRLAVAVVILAICMAAAGVGQAVDDAPDPSTLITAMAEDEGVPQNLVTAMAADEGVPQNLVTAMAAEEGPFKMPLALQRVKGASDDLLNT